MTPRFSAYLDAVRFAAALVVLLSHFAYERFSGGGLQFVRDLNVGSDAVMLFFVLSGLVIAHAAKRDGDLRGYVFARATRVYSVAIPAVILTLIADRVGAALAPTLYDGWWYAPGPILDQALRALTFSNEFWFQSTRIGTNGPYWSLTYEVWFYALFGAATFLEGARRWIAMAVLVLLAGPKILLLMPAWILGVVCYRRAVATSSLSLERARVWAFAPPIAYVVCQAFGVPEGLRAVTEAALGSNFVEAGLRFSDEFIWNGVLGVLAAVHFAGMARLMQTGEASRLTPVWRWCAGAAFSLYLVHYPLLQLSAAVLPETPWGIGTLMATLIGCFLFAQMFERTLKTQRRWCKALLRRRRASVSA